MFDFKFEILAKFCVIEGISEIMYIHTYVCILSTCRFICPLVIPPWVIISGHTYI